MVVYYSDYMRHRRECSSKQRTRESKIARLPAPYHAPLHNDEKTSILDRPIQGLVQDVHNNALNPIDILRTYGKVALLAHKKTNCLTEIMLPEAENWIKEEIDLKGPLAGIPVSLKDSLVVGGFDTSVGYSANTHRPSDEDGIMVKLLKNAGAVPFVKTNLPTSLLSFESTNDVWGRTTNPHNSKYSPGGSTGGESALLAYGGSRIGIGSDVAGSVRAPAHFSGCYSIRCSTGRWPKVGFRSSMPGQEGIPSVYSPMARTLNDLVYFTRAFIQSKPWTLDYSVHPLPWRDDVEDHWRTKPCLNIGVMRTDEVVDPSPACARALDETVRALQADGHTVQDIYPPSPFEALRIASILLNSDGCKTFSSVMRPGEWLDSGAKVMYNYMRMPWLFRKVHYWWVKYIRRDEIWAGLLSEWTPGELKSAEQWKVVARREAYKARFFDWWQVQEDSLDVILCPVNALPATPHDAMATAAWACGYTFLFNLLDYSAGVIPVTKVDATKDALPQDFEMSKLNAVAKGIYRYYDADAMHGLPVAVQIVGKRLEEEKVCALMERVEAALEKHNGGKYELLKGYEQDGNDDDDDDDDEKT